MHVCIVCLSFTVYHHVSIAVATTIRVTYKNIRKSMSKFTNEPLDVIKIS
jgi:hypothetical protein